MKPNIRWQLLLALACLSLVLALLSVDLETGPVSPVTGIADNPSVCTTRVPAEGGVLREGIVGAPRFPNPLLSDANLVDQELVSLLFDGLTRFEAGSGRLVPALAESWTISEDARVFRFVLRPDVRWHDGEPVTAADVAYTYGLMQSEAFPGRPSLVTLWSSVAIAVEDARTIVFTLEEPFSPFLAATTRGILPAHAFEGVTAAELTTSPRNTLPIGTGPFRAADEPDWRRQGELRLLPQENAWQTPPLLEAIVFRFFPSADSVLEAYLAGEIDAINWVPPEHLEAVALAPESHLFTATSPQFSQLVFNVSVSGATAVQSPLVRQALALATDRPALVDQAASGQGLVFDGPFLPSSWAYNEAEVRAYTPDLNQAAALLDEAGWPWPDGEAFRSRDEAPLSLRLVTPQLAREERVAATLAAQWARAGIAVELSALPLDAYAAALGARDFDIALVTIAPPADPDLYDFWSQEAIINGQNYAGWNSRRASEALERARQLADEGARRPLYDIFLRHFERDLPAFTLFQDTYTYAVRGDVQRLDIGRIDAPRDRYRTLNQWYVDTREVPSACPTSAGALPDAALPDG